MVLCSIPGVNHLQRQQGWAGDQMLTLPQQDHFVVAELLTLGTFTFLRVNR